MQRTSRLLPVLVACALMAACGGDGKRFNWYDDVQEEDLLLDADAPDADATDALGDGVDPDAADARDTRDARDVRDVRDVRDPGPGPDDGGEDPGDDEGATDPGEDPSDPGADPADPGDGGPDDPGGVDVLVVPCLVKEECFGLVLPGPCQTLDCVDGRCVTPPVPDSTRCDDLDACTEDDRCRAGACEGRALDCEDGSPCTLDGCVPATGCTREFVAGECDDGDACTVDDSCQQGFCVGSLRDCSDGDPCTSDGCDAATGCTWAPVTGRTCDDGKACTAGDRCLAGTCSGTSNCDDGNPCTQDTCGLAGCTRDPVPGACNDGDPCTIGDTCTDGICAGTSSACDDGNPCTVDACVPGVGCTWTLRTGACDDGDPCTAGDDCRDGLCRGTAITCEDPPDPWCLTDGTTVVRNDPVGTCADGECAYRATSHTCALGCVGGVCVGNPCEGVDCSTPPGPCWRAGTCVQGACEYPPDDGKSCDDGDACTTGGRCLAGACVAGPAVGCDDGSPCTADRCDRLAGCVHDPLAGPCEDGSPCTTGDTCQAGRCEAGGATSCDDGNSCTVDTCVAPAGCQHAGRPDGTACDDGNGCTGTDRCQGGACLGTGLRCDDGDPCTDDLCDDPLVGCYALPNTAPCDDGNACTSGDRCAAGECIPGATASCDDQDPCTLDGCDPAAGCTHGAASGAACDDGDPCTGGDTCLAGTCAGTPACDDGNACTDDSCDMAGLCTFTARDGACDDGNECTTGDACVAGTCGGAPRVCDDGNPCTDDSCQRGLGCTSTEAEPRVCDDGNGCTQGDFCESGLCRGRPVVCDDPPPNTCNPEEGFIVSYSRQGTCTDDACVYPRQEHGCTFGCEGTTCLGDPCEGIDCSQAPGTCYASPGICVEGSCDFEPVNGIDCDDLDPCTLSDACQNGACVGGDLQDCDDGLACTTDRCVPGTGCTHDPAAGACEDGDACTLGDACGAGACVPGPRTACDDGNPCTTDTCDALAGCANAPVADGFPCSDGNSCTTSDRCQAGRCAGDGLSCDDGNPCTEDRCDDPATGCYHPPVDGTCTDGNPCTTGDACVDGTCAPGAPEACDDGNYCTDDACSPLAGCTHTNHTRTCADAFCSDLTFYPARSCGGGQCVTATRVNCADGVACTADSCSAAGCSNTPTDGLCADDGDPCTAQRCHPLLGCQYVSDALPCDDGDACTFLDTCAEGGGCAGTVYACNDGMDCTADACDGFGGCHFVVVPGSCRIGQACYLDRDVDPADPCHRCDPAQDPYGWSPRDGVPCTDGRQCTTGDTCQGGTCAGTILPCDDANPCTTDRCDEVAGCVNADNTLDCSDDNPCTTGDRCQGGACKAGIPEACEDGNPCTSSECSPSAGCTFAHLATSCEDGDACTVGDACAGGTCQAGGQRDCDDGNPCTSDACNPDTGCTHGTAGDGTSCDDGVTCTTGDSCQAGRCTGTGPDCDDDNPCTDDRCDTPEAGCYHVDNALACNDGTACTAVDACAGGTCTGTQPLDCDDGNPCTTDDCDPVTGCTHVQNDDPCEDGNACTEGDACWLGRCLGGSAVACDDHNPCTTDRCDPVTGCTTTPITLPCDDGDTCTSGDVCTGGTCGGTPYVCNDGRTCTADACDGRGGCTVSLLPERCLIQGACYTDGQVNPNDPCRICRPSNTATAWTDNAGGACDDGRICTFDDRCSGGVCAGTSYACGDGIPCTTDACDGLGGCQNTVVSGWCAIGTTCWSVGDENPANPCQKCAAGTPRDWSDNDGAACTDGDPCTTQDSCLDGACTGGPQRTCNDGNACTDDLCDSASGGCTYTNNAAVCGAAGCQGLLYQAERVCSGGICPPPGPLNCDDGNACTTDTCDATGCHHEPNWESCDDHNPCTYGDTCASGTCQGTAYVCETSECVSRSTCDGAGGCIPSPRPDGSACSADTNACTNDICQAGACQHPPKVDGTSCADGNACTRTDICQAGTCTGTAPITCPAADTCHEDGTCDPATGACTPPVKPDGASCDDGNLCTQLDTCLGGACAGSDPKVCQPLDACHLAGACYPLTGECTNPARTDGAQCDDGNPCTRTDTCQAGACAGGNPLPCLARDACHEAGTCDPLTGTCSDPEALDGKSCDDGNKCTHDDGCTAGRCGGTDVTCVARDACHDPGTCDPSTGVCSQPAKAEGAPCDDGVACTKEDACHTGACSGVTYGCGDSLLCTADQCRGDGTCDNPLLSGWCLIGGACQPEGLPDPGNPCRSCQPGTTTEAWSARAGAACQDADACTKDDACTADGVCAGQSYPCDDGVSCTDDICDGAGGCQHPQRPGTCRIDGACHAGGAPNPANPCEVCRPSVDASGWTPAGEGDGCDDGNACSWSDVCIHGVCAGISYSCSDGRSCTADTCLGDGRCDFTPLAGTCYIRSTCFDEGDPDPLDACRTCVPTADPLDFTAAADGQACDDGNGCTSSDQCTSGTCRGTGTTCDDGRVCTVDSCDGLGGCNNVRQAGWCVIDGACVADHQQNPANPCEACESGLSTGAWSPRNGAWCDDGDACTLGDACVGAACTGGTPKDCGDDHDCTTDGCLAGTCTHDVQDGWCVAGGDCRAGGTTDPLNPCNLCDPVRDPRNWSYDDGVACDDAVSCTRDDRCSAGACSGAPYACDDGLACTEDACSGNEGCVTVLQPGWCLVDGICRADGDPDPDNGCQACVSTSSTTAWTTVDGVPCDDGSACTGNDRCLGGTCQGVAAGCDDSRVCTDDTCDLAGICRHAVRAGWCLIGGQCVAAGTTEPGDDCHSCQPGVDLVGWSPVTGTACDDGNDCTAMDTCSLGICLGVGYSCDDGLSCTNDACTGGGDCQRVQVPDTCWVDAACWTPGQANPLNPCQDCVPASALRDWTPVSGRTCNDGQACTKDDACDAGACRGTTFNCLDALPCTLDSCDGSGGCANPLADGWCLIDGTCHMNGSTDPGASCRACNAALDRYGWTVLSAGAPEVCNGVDDNCDGITDPAGLPDCTVFYRDQDQDGSGVTGDSLCLCRAAAPYAATEPGDCDDTNGFVRPGGTENCDGNDNDCDGTTDPEGTPGCIARYFDFDGDGRGAEGTGRCLCANTGLYRAVVAGDCDDTDPTRADDFPEICDGRDNDCDGVVDPPGTGGCVPWYTDADGDGYGGTTASCQCGAGGGYVVTVPGDCDDAVASANPAGTEVCNSRDDNCNGSTDEGEPADLCPLDGGIDPHGTVTSCLAGTCRWECAPAAGDSPAWYDTDGLARTGCECQGDAYDALGSSNCQDAAALGELPDSGVVKTVDGKLVTTGDEDWYTFRAVDQDPGGLADGCDTFHVLIRLAENPGESFRLDVFQDQCPNIGSCDGATVYEWNVNFYDSGAGECPCASNPVPTCTPPFNMARCLAVEGSMQGCGSCPGDGQPGTHVCADNSRDYWVRVRRLPDAPLRCDTYRLELVNGNPP